MKHMIQKYGSWTEMFLCHPIEISISLKRLYQSSPFFHHCKGESMTYLEMDIICSRFFLFLKYSSHPMIAVFCLFAVLFVLLLFLFLFFDSPGIYVRDMTDTMKHIRQLFTDFLNSLIYHYLVSCSSKNQVP